MRREYECFVSNQQLVRLAQSRGQTLTAPDSSHLVLELIRQLTDDPSQGFARRLERCWRPIDEKTGYLVFFSTPSAREAFLQLLPPEPLPAVQPAVVPPPAAAPSPPVAMEGRVRTLVDSLPVCVAPRGRGASGSRRYECFVSEQDLRRLAAVQGGGAAQAPDGVSRHWDSEQMEACKNPDSGEYGRLVFFTSCERRQALEAKLAELQSLTAR